MRDAQVNDLDKRIIKALKKSSQMLLEQKGKNKQKMAILENGKIKIIDFSKQSNKKQSNKKISKRLNFRKKRDALGFI